MTQLADNWLIVLIALLAAILIAWYIFHASRRTRVTGASRDVLDEGAAPAERNQALIDAPAAATRDVPLPPATPEALAGVGMAVSAAVEAATQDRTESELGRLKGVGPKLVARLQELGITRLDQVAAWTDDDIDRVDSQLDRFAGRIRRDDWVGQARLLNSGDTTGYAEKFGAIN